MSKENTRIIFAHKSKSANHWNAAISDAHKQINEAKAKISRLRQAIKVFEELRESGQLFPGEKSNQGNAQAN